MMAQFKVHKLNFINFKPKMIFMLNNLSLKPCNSKTVNPLALKFRPLQTKHSKLSNKLKYDSRIPSKLTYKPSYWNCPKLGLHVKNQI